MTDFKKSFEDWKNFVNESSDKIVKTIDSTAKDVTDKVKLEKRKLELKSQIGEHQRAVTKAYTRLGEAYYESLTDSSALNAAKDVIELISTNRKVIDLLNDQLASLEPVAEETTTQPVEETEAKEEKTEE